MSIRVLVQRVGTHGNNLPLPQYKSDRAAGMDLYAVIDNNIKKVLLAPLQRYLCSTGISIALPFNSEAQIRPRSGLAFEKGITVLNSPGTIDADYRGEIKVLLVNLSEDEVWIEHGTRIAQLVIAPVIRGELELVDKLPETKRGSGGFGSTGSLN